MLAPLKYGPWLLSDLESVPKNGRTVFSCFHCGGGSTMGYKLAGFDVLGGVEIDPEMMSIYRANHKPRHSFLMGVQEFAAKSLAEMPHDLMSLDILDGSPPCSSFSMAGSREKAWGDKKKFREGQTEQVLDDLFFHFIDVAKKLQPKVVVAENVKGLLIGRARGYVKEIFAAFSKAGYDCQLFLLNSSRMGVPQRRERTFFIARRRDLCLPSIKLEFAEAPITFRQATDDLPKTKHAPLTPTAAKYWSSCAVGASFASVHPKGSLFNWLKIDGSRPLGTLVSTNADKMFHDKEPRTLSDAEWLRCQTFPHDFDFLKTKKKYVIGMSVPPFMMQRVAREIHRQWLGGQSS